MSHNNSVHDHTIEPADTGVGVVVWEHGEYGPASVLAGNPLRRWVRSYPTVEKAKADWPRARVLDHSTRVPVTVSHTPPDWFDPANAGERWDDDC
jgi:hypothetical protein